MPDLTVPAESRIARGLGLGRHGPFGRMRLAVGVDLQATGGGQLADRQRSAKRILFITQVTGHADPEDALWRTAAGEWPGRLIDHPQLVPLGGRNRFADPCMQAHDTVGQGQRAERLVRIAVDEPVCVRAGQDHDQRAVRVQFGEGPDRGCAAPGMQGDHQIGTLSPVVDMHVDPVPESAQQSCPAIRGGAVARTRTGRGGGDQRDVHAGISACGRTRATGTGSWSVLFRVEVTLPAILANIMPWFRWKQSKCQIDFSPRSGTQGNERSAWSMDSTPSR